MNARRSFGEWFANYVTIILIMAVAMIEVVVAIGFAPVMERPAYYLGLGLWMLLATCGLVGSLTVPVREPDERVELLLITFMIAVLTYAVYSAPVDSTLASWVNATLWALSLLVIVLDRFKQPVPSKE